MATTELRRSGFDSSSAFSVARSSGEARPSRYRSTSSVKASSLRLLIDHAPFGGLLHAGGQRPIDAAEGDVDGVELLSQRFREGFAAQVAPEPQFEQMARMGRQLVQA